MSVSRYYCYTINCIKKNGNYCILYKKNGLKEIDAKNYTYYFFDDIINIKNLDSNKIKIEENSSKSIPIY